MTSVNVDALKAMFSSEEAVGITYDDPYNDGSEMAMLPGDFGDMGRCTNCAHYVVDHVGHGDVFGFLVDNNPDADHHAITIAGGHDFAVINDRYIVDLWISLFTGEEEKVVYDLLDPGQADKIQSIFGDPVTWRWYNPAKGVFVD